MKNNKKKKNNTKPVPKYKSIPYEFETVTSKEINTLAYIVFGTLYYTPEVD